MIRQLLRLNVKLIFSTASNRRLGICKAAAPSLYPKSQAIRQFTPALAYLALGLVPRGNETHAELELSNFGGVRAIHPRNGTYSPLQTPSSCVFALYSMHGIW